MRVGTREPLSEDIKNLGFTEVDSLKILGMDIDFDLECLNTCHDTTIRKLEKIGNFWKRFNLSLPGRLNIINTLMLSQLSYLGCFIFPNTQQILAMKVFIENFAKKKFKSQQRSSLPTTELRGARNDRYYTLFKGPAGSLD